jgi:16S rRNA (cytosine967-C5)-methyltransferase
MEQESKKASGSDSETAESVRRLAAEILAKVDTRKAYADLLLDYTLKSAGLDARDRALVTELTYGTLRWRGRLDGYVNPRIRGSLKTTDPFIRNLLRLTLYQLMFLDRIPDYAAVNEAVKLAKSHGGRSTAGFVNGVLRTILRGKEEAIGPELTDGRIGNFAEYWSHPEWLVQRWLQYFGSEEIEPLLKANNEEAPLVLRTNLNRGTREALLDLFASRNVQALPSPWSPQGIRIESNVPVDELPGFQDGRFQIQGEASQLVAYLLGPKPGERILDACAAPGGKTTHVAELMADCGLIVATDISAKGIEHLKENVKRLGLKSIHVLCADITRGLSRSAENSYDRVLVDAPCSGFGTLRSHPEIKWNRSESDIRRLSQLQERILIRSASYLKPGGILVYSTCTLIEDENEKVIEDLLHHHREFVLEQAANYLPEQAKSIVHGSYFLALPQRHNTDGFFAARLRKVA